MRDLPLADVRMVSNRDHHPNLLHSPNLLYPQISFALQSCGYARSLCCCELDQRLMNSYELPLNPPDLDVSDTEVPLTW